MTEYIPVSIQKSWDVSFGSPQSYARGFTTENRPVIQQLSHHTKRGVEVRRTDANHNKNQGKGENISAHCLPVFLTFYQPHNREYYHRSIAYLKRRNKPIQIQTTRINFWLNFRQVKFVLFGDLHKNRFIKNQHLKEACTLLLFSC